MLTNTGKDIEQLNLCRTFLVRVENGTVNLETSLVICIMSNMTQKSYSRNKNYIMQKPVCECLWNDYIITKNQR